MAFFLILSSASRKSCCVQAYDCARARMYIFIYTTYHTYYVMNNECVCVRTSRYIYVYILSMLLNYNYKMNMHPVHIHMYVSFVEICVDGTTISLT